MEYHFSTPTQFAQYLYREACIDIYGVATTRAFSLGGFASAAAIVCAMNYWYNAKPASTAGSKPEPVGKASVSGLLLGSVLGLTAPVLSAYGVRLVVWNRLMGKPKIRSPTAWLVMGIRMAPATAAGAVSTSALHVLYSSIKERC